jgi:hypothetical protein
VVDFPAGVNEVNALQVNVYPNPASDELMVALSEQDMHHVAIYDVSGKLVQQIGTEGRTCRLDIRGLRPGTYSARVMADGRQYTKMFAKF